MIAATLEQPIIYFDGECNLCNGFVRFVIKRDKKKLFLFAPLQSPAGKEVMTKVSNGTTPPPDTMILHYNGKLYARSDAALKILSLMGGVWQVMMAARIIPRFLRNYIYDAIARNRYKLFGKSTCMVPTPELMDRFLVK